jgi:diguanylate cyclase (GGDEF)-like protein/PAS domain S-box-containing protein
VIERSAASTEDEQRRLIVDAADNGLLIVDEGGLIEYANAEAARLFGYLPGVLDGSPVALLECSALRASGDAGFEGAAPPDPIVLSVQGHALTARRADGSTIPVQIESRDLMTRRGRLALVSVSGVRERPCKDDRTCPLEERQPGDAIQGETSRPIGRWRFELASGDLSWSDEVYQIYGLPPTERPTVSSAIAGYDPADRARIAALVERAMNDGTPYRDEARIIRPDGSKRNVVHGGGAERSADGTIVAIAGFFRDVTEQENAERQRHRLSEYAGNANQAGKIGIWELDLRSKASAWDRNMYALYGIDETKPPTFALWSGALHPHDRERAVREVNADIAEGLPSDSEFRIIWENGEVHHIRSLATTVRDAAGVAVRVIGTDWDVTELRLLGRQLREEKDALVSSEARYRALTEALPQMVWVIDAATAFEYVNERWSAYTGLSLERSSAVGLAALIDTDDAAGISDSRAAFPPREFECEARLRRFDGKYRWHLVRGVPFANAAGDAGRWIITATDIEERKTAERTLAVTVAELEHRVHHDAMTDLPNRMLLMDRLSQAMTLANRTHGSLIVLYVDLDRFKAINDTFGHAAGDRVLKETGRRILATLRAGDTASRVGGDEFIVVCATTGRGEDVPHIATRLLKAITAPIEICGEPLSVESSIGVSVYPADGFDAETLIRKADAAMYSAKQSGRNSFRRYSNEAHISIVAAAEFEAELRHAIAAGELVVHYQPIIDLRAGRPTAAEALVRWQHPQRGLLMPVDFIAFAEERALIAQIGDVVLDAACAMLDRLKRSGHGTLSIAVNVSANQFTNAGFVEDIVAALAAHDTDAGRLTIEITESVVMGHSRATLSTLAELQALGVKLSIDDFGTGYSSLAYVKSFPVNTLKIDRSFVRDIADDATDQAIAKTIITLAHNLGMYVVAEGVETEAQLAKLRSFGADGMQGFLVSRALPGPDFERFIETFVCAASHEAQEVPLNG